MRKVHNMINNQSNNENKINNFIKEPYFVNESEEQSGRGRVFTYSVKKVSF